MSRWLLYQCNKDFFFIVVIFVLLCMHENGKQRKIPTAKHVGR